MNRLNMIVLLVGLCIAMFAGVAAAEGPFEKDLIKTSAGDLEITFIGHGTMIFTFAGKVIHVDPYGK
ncbi:MAG TPA: metal-dependent hydrolase, partial [Syntrophobacteraceae bacterium]|nr:metal-dependent hydrolase [Syntrophobacteraceae bacterium]